MLDRYINDIIDSSISDNDINKDSLYPLFLLSSIYRNLHKYNKYHINDEIYCILTNMVDSYCDFKYYKDLSENSKSLYHLTTLTNLYDDLIQNLSKYDLSQPEIDLIKKYIKNG